MTSFTDAAGREFAVRINPVTLDAIKQRTGRTLQQLVPVLKQAVDEEPLLALKLVSACCASRLEELGLSQADWANDWDMQTHVDALTAVFEATVLFSQRKPVPAATAIAEVVREAMTIPPTGASSAGDSPASSELTQAA